MKNLVRVASGQGFWGDSLDAPRQQVEGGQIDYLMLDYLAEVTMSILQKQKERDPSMGYARDFIGAIESVLQGITERGVKVIANAGGVNPPACAAAIRALTKSEKLRIAVVTGDDLLGSLDELIESGHALSNMESGEPLSSIRDRVLSANAYIGSVPIVEGLTRGANVVITGRSTDTALTMAPLRFEFGWKDNEWDKLAAGIIAGHIIECGAQCSGGNCLYDWKSIPKSIPDLANVGYPIAEAKPDGSFVITKHEGTGGRINVPSVAEQLVYEMGDPHEYITPDVVADFTTIQLAQDGPDRVKVFGIKGRPATDKLKVSIAYRSGFKAVGTLVYAWPEAYEKAQAADRVLRERLDRLGLKFDQILTEFVGVSSTHGRLTPINSSEVNEVQLRVGVRGENRKDVERFTREIAPLVLNGPPSVTGFAGGRPKVEEIVAYWPALIDKKVVNTKVEIV
jgi:hypothetical protein